MNLSNNTKIHIDNYQKLRLNPVDDGPIGSEEHEAYLEWKKNKDQAYTALYQSAERDLRGSFGNTDREVAYVDAFIASGRLKGALRDAIYEYDAIVQNNIDPLEYARENGGVDDPNYIIKELINDNFNLAQIEYKNTENVAIYNNRTQQNLAKYNAVSDEDQAKLDNQIGDTIKNANRTDSGYFTHNDNLPDTKFETMVGDDGNTYLVPTGTTTMNGMALHHPAFKTNMDYVVDSQEKGMTPSSTLPFTNTAGTMIYSEEFAAEEFPQTNGTSSLFNQFSVFSYSMVGTLGGGSYDANMHFDYDPTRESIKKSDGTALTIDNVEVEDPNGPLKGMPNLNNKWYKKFEMERHRAPGGSWSFDSENDIQNMGPDDNQMNNWKKIRRWFYTAHTGYGQDSGDTKSIANTLSASELDKPTAKILVDFSHNVNNAGRFPTMLTFSWYDFLYCKWYGKIPNNRLIVLRRYPFCVGDNASNYNDDALVPIAQALTYFGEGTDNSLKSILKLKYGLKWGELTSNVQDVDGNECGFGSTLGGATGSALVNIGGAVTAFSRIVSGDPVKSQAAMDQYTGKSEKEVKWYKNAWGDNGAYWNEVLGPVNVIDKIYRRERGINFNNDITIKFAYTLRSWNGVNPKVAMLDLIHNFLRLTTNNAKFWGGATRYFPNMQNSINMLGHQDDWYNGNYDKYFESLKADFLDTANNLAESFETFKSNLDSSEDESILDKLKNLGSSIWDTYGKSALAVAFGNYAKMTRPEMLSIKSLLRGTPVGEWHLTIGNPLNPIAVMGNMIVDGVNVEFGEVLGIDDFPTEVTFSVALKHGRPRDLGDTESMFNMGMGKMSYTPLIKLPSELNTMGEHGGTDADKAAYSYNSAMTEQINAQQTQAANTFDLTASMQDKDRAVSGSRYNQSSDELYNVINSNEDSIRKRVYKQWGKRWSQSSHLAQIIKNTNLKF